MIKNITIFSLAICLLPFASLRSDIVTVVANSGETKNIDIPAGKAARILTFRRQGSNGAYLNYNNFQILANNEPAVSDLVIAGPAALTLTGQGCLFTYDLFDNPTVAPTTQTVTQKVDLNPITSQLSKISTALAKIAKKK